MVLTRTKCTRFNRKSTFGETVNKFQDCNLKTKASELLENILKKMQNKD